MGRAAVGRASFFVPAQGDRILSAMGKRLGMIRDSLSGAGSRPQKGLGYIVGNITAMRSRTDHLASLTGTEEYFAGCISHADRYACAWRDPGIVFCGEAALKGKLIACTAIVTSLGFHCHIAAAQCSLTVEEKIISGWNKKNVSYTADGNTLKIKGGDGAINDADSIYIGSMKGCSTLTVKMAQVSGDFPWGGKMIGISFFDRKLEPGKWGGEASFPPPRGRAMETGFIKTALSSNTELVYDIKNTADITYIGAKVFIGSNTALEIHLSGQDDAGGRTESRSSKPYTPSAPQPATAAASCYPNCREPQSRRSLPVVSRDFSIPIDASCGYDEEDSAEYMR
jgi:hypothetical protein